VNLSQLADLFAAEATPLLRTDFSDDEAWLAVVAALSAEADFGDEEDEEDDGAYLPNVEAISDAAFEGLTGTALAAAWADHTARGGEDEKVGGYVVLVDARAMADLSDITVDYVDLDEEPGRTFRCAVAEFSSIEANLSVANMDFEDFADSVGPDGVFRGFPTD